VYRHLQVIPLIWLVWALYWWYAARNTKAVEWRETKASRLLNTVPLVAAFILLSPSRVSSGAAWHGAAAGAALYGLGIFLTAAGLLFAVWARVRLAGNWSGTVSIKQEHELVTTGAYAVVRHPIYAGLLLGIAGSALAIGAWRGLAAFALASVAIGRRVWVEESAMRRRFGADYDRYAARVPALLPLPR